MAGLYVHVPFCKQACSYCNFHFSTNLNGIDRLVDALLKELTLRNDYLNGHHIESIYLGGGTPSLLNEGQLNKIISAISQVFTVVRTAEITLEANPDDLDNDKLRMLAASPVNRLSIGVQSFRDQDLSFMHRAHNASQALASIENSLKFGFENLSVDLIYGIPGLSMNDWRNNLGSLVALGVPHWSCYSLTIEPQTLLSHLIQKKKVAPVQDEIVERHFLALIEFAAKYGYDHYEISNFSKPMYVARHNVNYWRQKPYLGLGPSAHSFDGKSRSWNVANNARYLREIEESSLPLTTEVLTPDQRYNEYVMTGLRTKWGCNGKDLVVFGSHYESHFLNQLIPFKNQGWLVEKDGVFTLTTAGKLFADHIASELFIV
ncbi:MAG: radical SAM family heme chaperone HemW [Saprospiraceae bacterium]|nr:radical SAM family heme chaperone HemW [Saprospiraceae bacterium]